MSRLLFLALALCACAKPDRSSPFSALVVTYESTTGTYRLGQVRLNTLTSLRRLQGAAGQVRAGGSVRLSRQEYRTIARVAFPIRTLLPASWRPTRISIC